MKTNLFLSVIITIVLSSLSLSLTSQDESSQSNNRFIFGTELGAIYGTPIGPAEKGATGKPGLAPVLGFFARYKINDKWGIQTGLNYNEKKASYNSPVIDQSYDYTYEEEVQGNILVFEIDSIILNGSVRGKFFNKYLQAPFLVYYDLNDKLSIQGGGYISYLLSGGHDVWASGVLGNNFTTLDDYYSNEKNSISNWDYGASLVVNYDIYKHFEAELRITTGLRSVFSDEYVLAEDRIRNVYLALKINYTFKL